MTDAIRVALEAVIEEHGSLTYKIEGGCFSREEIFALGYNAALAQLVDAPVSGEARWCDDMSKAPKDGTRVLIGDGKISISACWDKAYWKMDVPAIGLKPLCWRPLPSPPAPAPKEDDMRKKIIASPVPTDDDQRIINTVKNAFRLALVGEDEDMTMGRVLDLHLMLLQWLVATVVAHGVAHDHLERVINDAVDSGDKLRAVVQSLNATKQ